MAYPSARVTIIDVYLIMDRAVAMEVVRHTGGKGLLVAAVVRALTSSTPTLRWNPRAAARRAARRPRGGRGPGIAGWSTPINLASRSRRLVRGFRASHRQAMPEATPFAGRVGTNLNHYPGRDGR